jgi:hypothetical protein
MSEGRMALRGIIIGLVDVLGTSNTSGSISKSICHNWENVARLETVPARLYNKETSTTYFDAFWQTLCCSILLGRMSLHDSNVVRTHDDSSYLSWYKAWWTWMSDFDMEEEKIDLVSTEYDGSEIYSLDTIINVATWMRRLFISTNEEWLGLAPINTIAGDVIVLLEGGPVPYILRPKGETSVKEYELVGDAYVHGAMDGERWDPDLLQEIVLV